MSNINKRAYSVSQIIADLKLKHGSGDTYAPIMRWDELLALLDELEAKDRRIEEEIGRANREHHRGFMMACGHLKDYSNVHYADAAEMEIAALRNRINELESAPPAPVSVPDFPEILPCPVMLEPGLRFGKGVPTKAMLGALQRRAEYYAELDAMTPEHRAEHDAGMREFAAMLQGAEPVTTAYKLRDAVETIRNSGIEIDAEKIFAERDAINAQDCWCRTCRPITLTDMRFVVCPECGNKRCPHANDHRNACTGSNEPGQEGSAYPAAPQQEE